MIVAQISSFLILPVVMLAAFCSAVGRSVAAQAVGSCGQSDLYQKSHAQLQACGLTTVPLISHTLLPGGGVSYNYTLPDGQTYSIDQPPAAFDPSRASQADDAAYGLPPAPPSSSPGTRRGKGSLPAGGPFPADARTSLFLILQQLNHQPASQSSTGRLCRRIGLDIRKAGPT